MFLGRNLQHGWRRLRSVPALFLGAGLAACYLPAYRASRIDPNVALRNL